MRMNRLCAIGIAILATLSMVGCQKEDGPEKDGPVEGAPAWATFTLNQSAPSTYAGNADAEPTTNEKKVKEATVYIFADRALTNVVEFANATTSAVTKLTSGRKQFFACVNMKGIIPAESTPVGMSLDAFKKLIVERTAANMNAMTDASGFWMTNTGADAPEETVVQATKPEVEAPQNPKNNFKINVGRVVSKINVTKAPTCQEIDGTLSEIKFSVCNNPTKIYFMSVFDGPNYTGTHVLTPYYDATYKQTGVVGTGEVGLANYFEYPAAANRVAAGTPSYMLENSDKNVSAGKLSYVLVEGKWAPSKTNDGGTVAPGANFWRVAQYTDATKTTFVAYELGVYSTQVAAQGAATALGTKYGVVQFQAGKSYYRIPLQDLSTNPTEAAKDPIVKYTVRRNSYFRVNITKITGPGFNKPGEVVPNPDAPVETEAYIKADIVILPWVLVDQNAQI